MKKLYKTILMITIFIYGNATAAISTTAKQALLVDIDSNAILYSKNHTQKMSPSSMSKLMTVYLAFEKLKENQLQLSDAFIVSQNAWKKEGSRMFLVPNKEVTVENLLKGIIIQSGNDASIALAEGIDGNEEDFVTRMNVKAKHLGLKNSNFVNSTGWPHPNHYMTALDLAILAQRIIKDYPAYYHYFSETGFTYNKIKQQNRNTLIKKNIGVDGLKTGNTDAGGHGIIASASKNGKRLIVVINGVGSAQEREREARKLLQYGFLNFTNIKLAKANEPIISSEVWLGDKEKVNLISKEDITLSVSTEKRKHVKALLRYDSMMGTPVVKDTKMGTVEILLPDDKRISYDLYAEHNVKKAGCFKSFAKKIKYWAKSMSFKQPETTTIVKESKNNNETLIFS
jgi:serine-type D-Ala-D-Ala carboxypeptidase (penicillin-binding protein 5/6)